MITQVQEKYPNAKMFVTTLRQVISANEHLWGAILLADGKWYVEEPREIQVMDRIGGGDGFSGGLLRRSERLGTGKMPAIRLGKRRSGGFEPERLRRTRR